MTSKISQVSLSATAIDSTAADGVIASPSQYAYDILVSIAFQTHSNRCCSSNTRRHNCDCSELPPETTIAALEHIQRVIILSRALPRVFSRAIGR